MLICVSVARSKQHTSCNDKHEHLLMLTLHDRHHTTEYELQSQSHIWMTSSTPDFNLPLRSVLHHPAKGTANTMMSTQASWSLSSGKMGPHDPIVCQYPEAPAPPHIMLAAGDLCREMGHLPSTVWISLIIHLIQNPSEGTHDHDPQHLQHDRGLHDLHDNYLLTQLVQASSLSFDLEKDLALIFLDQSTSMMWASYTLSTIIASTFVGPPVVLFLSAKVDWDSFENDGHLHTVDVVQQHKLAVDLPVRYGGHLHQHLLALGQELHRNNLHHEHHAEEEGWQPQIGGDLQAYHPQQRTGTLPPTDLCLSLRQV